MKGEDSFRLIFYLPTLAISQKMVHNVHQKKNKLTDMLKLDGHDKHTKVSDEQKNGVISHIDSFPVIKSRYCRAKKNKKKIWKQGLAFKRCMIFTKKNA